MWLKCVCVHTHMHMCNTFTSIYIDFKRSLDQLIGNIHRKDVYLSLGMGHNVGEQVNESE